MKLLPGADSPRDAIMLIKQVLSCINYSHTNNIVHIDLKPGNLLHELPKDLFQIKIIDFGTSFVDKDGENLVETWST